MMDVAEANTMPRDDKGGNSEDNKMELQQQLRQKPPTWKTESCHQQVAARKLSPSQSTLPETVVLVMPWFWYCSWRSKRQHTHFGCIFHLANAVIGEDDEVLDGPYGTTE